MKIQLENSGQPETAHFLKQTFVLMDCPTDRERLFKIFTSAQRRPVSNLHRCVQPRFNSSVRVDAKEVPRQISSLQIGFELVTRPLHLQSAPLLATQHQGVFCPDQKSQKLKFQVSFLGLNIALSPNLIGSSDADFHMNSESGLISNKKNQGSFGQTTVAFSLSTGMMKTLKATDLVNSKGNFIFKKAYQFYNNFIS